MIDFDKVRSGIDHHLDVGNCKGCPYSDDCDHHTPGSDFTYDVRQILGMANPRVLTREEASFGGDVWLEHKVEHPDGGINGNYILIASQSYGPLCTLIDTDRYGFRRFWNGYGRTWRCWDFEPTESRRHSEPWEVPNETD